MSKSQWCPERAKWGFELRQINGIELRQINWITNKGSVQHWMWKIREGIEIEYLRILYIKNAYYNTIKFDMAPVSRACVDGSLLRSTHPGNLDTASQEPEGLAWPGPAVASPSWTFLDATHDGRNGHRGIELRAWMVRDGSSLTENENSICPIEETDTQFQLRILLRFNIEHSEKSNHDSNCEMLEVPGSGDHREQ